MRHHVLIGCGYLGSRVAELWQKMGDQVTVLTRSPQRAAKFKGSGLNVFVGDVTAPATLKPLARLRPAIDSLVYAVGHDRRQSSSIHQVYAGGLQSVLAALEEHPSPRVIYISTTGVYGGASGSLIDESTAPCPARPGGLASLAAEKVLNASPFAPGGVVLRLAGIYGPGRLPYLESLRRGDPLEASAEGYLNLIHVADAATVVVDFASADSVAPRLETYCVCDCHPVLRRDFYMEIARQLATPEPRFAEVSSSPRALRAATSKRVDSRRLWTYLGRQPQYPSYREGVAQIVAGLNS